MNYLAELLAFSEWKETNPLSSSAISLWHELMAICNKTMWLEEFTVANGVLQAKAGLSRREFLTARDLLVHLGRIEYEKSSHVNQAGKYVIISFVQNGTQNGTQNEHRTGHETGHETCALTKHKTLNNTSLVPTGVETDNISPQEELNAATNETAAGKPRSKRYSFDQEHFDLALRLKERILENKPNFRVPNTLDQWADTIRLMVSQDKRTLEQTAAIIDWCQRDTFWQANILSAKALRDQFDKLEAKMNSKRNVYNMPQKRAMGEDLPWG